MNELVQILKNTRQHLMTGVSHMIPFVVSGGILLAVSVMLYGKGAVPVKRRTKNAKAFHDKCENFSFRASNETAVLITAFYSLHGDHLGYG